MEPNTYTPHVRVELKMSAKQERYWDISISLPEDRAREIPVRLQQMDGELRERFGGTA
jgi:hypothetical protein